MPTHSALERSNLADAMLSAGPDSPTLCTGWTVSVMAAHLVTREWRPDVAAGNVIPPLSGWMDRETHRYARGHDFEKTVAKFRSGPPLLGWSNLPKIDANLNLAEFLVHHEDVRRGSGDWEPRELPDDLNRRVWATAVGAGRFFLRRAGFPVTLEWASAGKSRTIGKGEGGVVMRGEPLELLLFTYGRRGAADVELDGPEAGQERLHSMKLGL
ncbi:TIGR03085 family metal-binding protein [Spongisporangium articulatum]|uniref:TIGR03085 family metal-binding protein n=1 Tax=Spongisporangium articulatum TaxID=3362603 RepID=A0ABW8ATJ9_9ACTN